jgi:hypothetical protein
LLRGRHGWFRVGHDESATETLASMLQDSGGLGAFAHVVMKIIRHAYRDAGAWRSFFGFGTHDTSERLGIAGKYSKRYIVITAAATAAAWV